jgi:hypothetical protein
MSQTTGIEIQISDIHYIIVRIPGEIKGLGETGTGGRFSSGTAAYGCGRGPGHSLTSPFLIHRSPVILGIAGTKAGDRGYHLAGAVWNPSTVAESKPLVPAGA